MRDRYCATLFLRNADKQHFKQLCTELVNHFSKGRDKYPATLTDAHQLLLTYKARDPAKQNDSGGSRGGRLEDGRGNRGCGGRGSDSGHGHDGYQGRAGRLGRSFVQDAFCPAQVNDHFPEGIPDHYILVAGKVTPL